MTQNKWNEWGFRPPLCTYRLNWARTTSWGWWDVWDDTVLQTQDSKFEPWRSEAEHATSLSRRLPTILTFTRGWGRNIFVSFKPPRPGTEPRTLAWKAAVLTTTLGPPPLTQNNPLYKIKTVCLFNSSNTFINYISTTVIDTRPQISLLTLHYSVVTWLDWSTPGLTQTAQWIHPLVFLSLILVYGSLITVRVTHATVHSRSDYSKAWSSKLKKLIQHWLNTLCLLGCALCRRQILTSKVHPCAVRVNIFTMSVEP